MTTTELMDNPHIVLVRGGHTLYCSECDRDIYSMKTRRGEREHIREIVGLLNSAARKRVEWVWGKA